MVALALIDVVLPDTTGRPVQAPPRLQVEAIDLLGAFRLNERR